MMVVNAIGVKRNDTGSTITATLTDAGGNAVDLSGATVKFTMTPDGSTTPKVNKQGATIVTAASGIVRYTWQAGDLDTAGPFRAEWEVTFGGGAVQTYPGTGYLRVYVGTDLA
jgi:hypothetical protein